MHTPMYQIFCFFFLKKNYFYSLSIGSVDPNDPVEFCDRGTAVPVYAFVCTSITGTTKKGRFALSQFG